MTRRSPVARAVCLACAVLAAGCGRDAARHEPRSDAARHEPRSDVREASPDSSTVEAAVAVVRGYYAAIDAGDYQAAYRAWSNDGAATGQSYTQFASGFSHTRRVITELGTAGPIGAAAGSRFVEVPVTIRAEMDGGATERYQGSVVLRRSEVDGSTAAQRRWHLYSASVKRVP